jgi:hypothetical protein
MSRRIRRSLVSSCQSLRIVVLKTPLDDDLASDPLKGINVDAAGGASKVLRMLAEKVSCLNWSINRRS